MPSLTGGDSSARDYAPHMWILGPGGNPDREADYQFVGNLGNVSVTVDQIAYHIGANALGEVICDARTRSDDWRTLSRFLGNVPVDTIPQDVLQAALDRALDVNAISADRQQLILSLAGSIPALAGIAIEFPEAVSFADVFGDPTAQEKARDQIDDFELVISGLRTRLGFSTDQ